MNWCEMRPRRSPNYVVERDARQERPRAFHHGRYTTYEESHEMPPKVRELIAELQRSGFVDRGGKGSHRNFVHPKVAKPITISGAPGDDAKHYQIRAVTRAIDEAKS